MPVTNVSGLIEDRVSAIRDAAACCGSRIELDVSGGIDSAVMLALAVLAVGPDNITACFSSISSQDAMQKQAQDLADALEVPLISLDLTEVFSCVVAEMLRGIGDAYDEETLEQVKARIAKDPTVLGSMRSCIRAPIGRGLNRMTGNGIRLGTGNECEDRYLRFYQKGGDGEVDCNPMAMLSKGEVYQLAVGLGDKMGPDVARAMRPIIEVGPQHDLWAGGDTRDESELKTWTGANFTYSTVSPATGEYLTVGTIERVSRFLDYTLAWGIPHEALLFGEQLNTTAIAYLTRVAQDSPLFAGIPSQSVGDILRAARRAERRTRHKINPNCPMYGSREDFVARGILTNYLPISLG